MKVDHLINRQMRNYWCFATKTKKIKEMKGNKTETYNTTDLT